MSFLDEITVLILTYNEEANIERTLDGVSWARRILIVDSGSTDRTHEIVSRYPNAKIVTREFDGFASQCNFGLAQIETPWVLSLDADYEVSSELVREITNLTPSEEISGFSASFIYCIHGKPLRASLYPPRTVLYRRDCAQYHVEGHGHRVQVDGGTEKLAGKILHDDRKPLARWVPSQIAYAANEADFLLSAPRKQQRWSDRIRRLALPAPLIVFFYTLIVKGCFLDGWAGWYYVLQRTLAEALIAIEIIDRRLSSFPTANGPQNGPSGGWEKEQK